MQLRRLMFYKVETRSKSFKSQMFKAFCILPNFFLHKCIIFFHYWPITFAISQHIQCFHKLQTLQLKSKNQKMSKNKVWQHRRQTLMGSISSTFLQTAFTHANVLVLNFFFPNNTMPNLTSKHNQKLHPTFTLQALCFAPVRSA